MILPLLGKRVGGGGSSYTGTITVPAGEVTADLTGFPVMVDMANLPPAFWTAVRADGGDVRMVDGVTPIACDVVTINKGASTGRLFFRAPTLLAASNRAFAIQAGSGAAKLLNTDPIGRNAVWAGFHRMYAYEEPGALDRTGNGAGGPPWFEPNYRLAQASVTGTLTGGTGHVQGVCWDGTHYYVTWTNGIFKYNSAWGLVASLPGAIAAAGLGGVVTHMGGCCHVGGLIYIATETYAGLGAGSSSNQRIVVFNTSLAHVANYDISAQDRTVSDVAYRASNGFLYVSDYYSANVEIYNLTGVHQGTLLTSPEREFFAQGITFLGDRMFVSEDTPTRGNIVEMDPNTGASLRVIWREDEAQGLDTIGAQLLHAVTTNIVRTLNDYPGGTMPGGIAGWYNSDATNDGFAGGEDLSQLSVWTAGVSIRFNALGGVNRPIFGYMRKGDATNGNRETAAFRTASTRLAMWNSTDSWFVDAGGAPTTGVIYRVNIAKDGTTARRLYRDGALAVTDTGTATRPGGSAPSAIYIGASDRSYSEMLDGSANYLYVFNGILSDAWLAAEASNWLNPAGFYTVS